MTGKDDIVAAHQHWIGKAKPDNAIRNLAQLFLRMDAGVVLIGNKAVYRAAFFTMVKLIKLRATISA
jgi:hypothetical protein